jgi:hypothetical protein
VLRHRVIRRWREWGGRRRVLGQGLMPTTRRLSLPRRRHGAEKLGQTVKFDEELDLADFCVERDAGACSGPGGLWLALLVLVPMGGGGGRG